MVNPGDAAEAQDIIKSTAIYAADTGADDTYAISLPVAPSAYVAGLTIHFKVDTGNTGAATLNVNGLGAKNITKKGALALETGDMVAGGVYTVVYDGTQFQMQTSIPQMKKVAISTTEVSIANGATTNLFSTTIPGGTLGTNNAIRFTIYFSSYGQGSNAWEILLKYGGTTLSDIAPGNVTFASLKGVLTGYIIADGATNAQKAMARLDVTANEGEVAADAAVGLTKQSGWAEGTGAVDSTADQTFLIEFNGADAGNDLTAEFCIIEVIR